MLGISAEIRNKYVANTCSQYYSLVGNITLYIK
jgi:hypothetical protein